MKIMHKVIGHNKIYIYTCINMQLNVYKCQLSNLWIFFWVCDVCHAQNSGLYIMHQPFNHIYSVVDSPSPWSTYVAVHQLRDTWSLEPDVLYSSNTISLIFRFTWIICLPNPNKCAIHKNLFLGDNKTTKLLFTTDNVVLEDVSKPPDRLNVCI